MFNAEYFTYDGIPSQEFGLIIADFDNSNVKETDAFSPELSLLKAPGQIRFFHGKVEYSTAPTCEFSVISERIIDAGSRSVILSWLVGRKEFLPLEFIGGDNVDYVYFCVFTAAKTIWVNGQCHGFRLTAEFDSQFARAPETTISVAGTQTGVKVMNNSDIDDYVYPLVEFTGPGVDIVNTTDDPGRHFIFENLEAGERITVDNELRHISSSIGGPKLENFTSKKWLRLKKGANYLNINSAGTVTITCPSYKMVGY